MISLNLDIDEAAGTALARSCFTVQRAAVFT